MKTKVLISSAMTAQLICAFVFEIKVWFSLDEATILNILSQNECIMTQFELFAFVALIEMNFLASRSSICNYPSYGPISVDFDDPISLLRS